MTEGPEASEQSRELHVVFGTGPVGLAVADELSLRRRRVRLVNRSGRAVAPEGAEVVGGDATDQTFAREASAGAAVVYFALNPPYNRWPELFPSLQQGVFAAHNAGKVRVTAGRASDFFGPQVTDSAAGEIRARCRQRARYSRGARGGPRSGLAPARP